MSSPLQERALLENRRQFFGRTSCGIGTAALASLLGGGLPTAQAKDSPQRFGGLPDVPHFHGKAKRVIYLLQSGAPSQVDLLDYKPSLDKLHGTELPASIRMGQRLTGMTAGQKTFPWSSPLGSFINMASPGRG